MPLTVNVGLSRKASENYQSAGVSINLTAELDQALLARPHELQQQIQNLYEQAHQAVEAQTGAPAIVASKAAHGRSGDQYDDRNGDRSGDRHARTYSPGNGRGVRDAARNGNGSGNGNGHARQTQGSITASQRRAILAIAQRLDLDAEQEAHQQFGEPLAALSIRDASTLIDHRKRVQQSLPSGGGR